MDHNNGELKQYDGGDGRENWKKRNRFIPTKQQLCTHASPFFVRFLAIVA